MARMVLDVTSSALTIVGWWGSAGVGEWFGVSVRLFEHVQRMGMSPMRFSRDKSLLRSIAGAR